MVRGVPGTISAYAGGGGGQKRHPATGRPHRPFRGKAHWTWRSHPAGLALLYKPSRLGPPPVELLVRLNNRFTLSGFIEKPKPIRKRARRITISRLTHMPACKERNQDDLQGVTPRQ